MAGYFARPVLEDEVSRAKNSNNSVTHYPENRLNLITALFQDIYRGIFVGDSLGMSDILAPALIIFCAIIVVAVFVGQKFGSKWLRKSAPFFFGIMAVGIIVALAIWANWTVFVESPETCHRSITFGRAGTRHSRIAPWEECRGYMTIAAIVLDLFIVGAVGWLFYRKR